MLALFFRLLVRDAWGDITASKMEKHYNFKAIFITLHHQSFKADL